MKKTIPAVILSVLIPAFALTNCTSEQMKAQEQTLKLVVNDLKNQLEAERAKVKDLQKQINDLTQQLNAEKDNVKKLQAQAAQNKQQFEAEKTKEADLFKRINDLTQQLAAEKTKEKGLQRQLDALNRQIESQTAATEKEQKQNEATYNQLLQSLKDEIKKDEVMINKYQDALTINIAERILFDFGRATIKPKYYPVLDKVGKILQSLPDKFIQIEGHTDNVPIAKDYVWKFPNNWALGAMRAINVTTYFIDHFKINPQRIAVMSFSKYRPLVPNTTPANRAKNRRIEIVILNKSLYQEMERKHGLPK
jgi:chemotaxis protein MotB